MIWTLRQLPIIQETILFHLREVCNWSVTQICHNSHNEISSKSVHAVSSFNLHWMVYVEPWRLINPTMFCFKFISTAFYWLIKWATIIEWRFLATSSLMRRLNDFHSWFQFSRDIERFISDNIYLKYSRVRKNSLQGRMVHSRMQQMRLGNYSKT